MSEKRRKAYDFGLLSESLAAFYLRLKGYRIITQRYKSPFGEIDLLAQRKKTLVAVEVKFRKKTEEGFGNILETIHTKNQSRVEKALLHFISHNTIYADFDLRFDVVCLSPPFHVHHLDNAWQARS